MWLTNAVFLPAVIFLAFVTAYEDIVVGKIRLKWIIAGLVYGVAGCLFILSARFLPFFNIALNYGYIKDLLINTAIAVAVSYLLWKLNIWASGDAKLFIVYVLLIPLEYYSRNYLKFFPGFNLLINIFMPLFLFIIFTAFVKFFAGIIRLVGTSIKEKRLFSFMRYVEINFIMSIRHKYREAFRMVIGYLLMFTLLQILMVAFKINSLWSIAIMMIFFKPLNNVLKKRNIFLILSCLLLVGYAIFVLYYFKQPVALIHIFKNTFQIVVLFGFLMLVIELYIKYTQVYKIDLKELKPFMILTEQAVKTLEGQPGKDSIANGDSFRETIGELYPDGLSEAQVKQVQGISRYKGLEKIEVYRTFPFAIWMSIGVILTLYFKENILSLLSGLWRI